MVVQAIMEGRVEAVSRLQTVVEITRRTQLVVQLKRLETLGQVRLVGQEEFGDAIILALLLVITPHLGRKTRQTNAAGLRQAMT